MKLPKILGILGAALSLGACVGNGWSVSDTSAGAGGAGRSAGEPGPGRDERNRPPVPSPMHPVALVEVHSEVALQLLVKGKKIPLHAPEDFRLQSRRLDKKGELRRSDWVFVGYGLTVSALGWDHYRNADVRGKTVVMLAGAPPIPDGAAVSSAEALAHPLGRSLGHWRGKFENARRHGAAAAIIVAQAGKGGLAPGETPEDFDGVMANLGSDAPDPLAVFGWVPEDRLAGWLKRAGLRWETLRKRAAAADFVPVPLPVQGNFQWANRWRELELSVPQ